MPPKQKIDIDAKIALRIKTVRTIQNMPLDVLAKKVGISLQMAYRYESGRTAFSVRRLIDFADALNLSVKYFLKDLL